MSYKRIDDYSEQILVTYRDNKGGKLSGYLSNPTPSQIRDACLQLFKETEKKSDQEIIRIFFGFNENENGYKKIENFKPGKLKAISDFLKEKSIPSHTPRLNLSALLVDFQPRPFARFQKTELEISSVEKVEEIKDVPPTNNPDVIIEGEDTKKGEKKRKRFYIKLAFYISLGAMPIIAVLNYNNIYNYFKSVGNVNCMTWSGDRYQKTTCGETDKSDIVYDKEIVENFRKAKNDTIDAFFGIGGKEDPLYWYYKKNNTVELFTADRMHPTENVPLKPITEHIVRTYILKE
ncbi:hypothetical protein GCM10022393_39260 [Aquimarina addita]|uniref:Uncharacterized protein n=1 Tax=Aquimarina addita TaxID=870485 RepID=A0ABP6UWV1_9FLAO